MRLTQLREEVLEANLELVRGGLVLYTFGNASGVDREQGLVVIKPSGVDYDKLKPEHMVVTDLEGNIIEGTLRPSSDLDTHTLLYREFGDIGAVVHTHSEFATSFAQAGLPITAFGTALRRSDQRAICSRDRCGDRGQISRRGRPRRYRSSCSPCMPRIRARPVCMGKNAARSCP